MSQLSVTTRPTKVPRGAAGATPGALEPLSRNQRGFCSRKEDAVDPDVAAVTKPGLSPTGQGYGLHKCWINLAGSTVTHAVQNRFFDKCDIGVFGARR